MSPIHVAPWGRVVQIALVTLVMLITINLIVSVVVYLEVRP